MEKILVKEVGDFKIEFLYDPEDIHTKFIISYFKDGHFQDEVFITNEDVEALDEKVNKLVL